jgi:hypothetical protein
MADTTPTSRGLADEECGQDLDEQGVVGAG